MTTLQIVLGGVDLDEHTKVRASVGNGSETFWIKLDDNRRTGFVDNDLVYSDIHGYRYGDKVMLDEESQTFTKMEE